jgi:hypothetical protein
MTELAYAASINSARLNCPQVPVIFAAPILRKYLPLRGKLLFIFC